MAVAASLSERTFTVQPGSDVTCDVQVRNTGEVVDQFSVDVVGDAASWTRVEPAIINLLPGDETTARVIFAPPRSSEVLAGTVDFAIRVLSREDPEGSTVEEGQVEVEPFTEVSAELVPRKRRGRRRARFRLIIDNTGNHDTSADVMAVDVEDDADLSVRPAQSTIRPGTAVVIRVRVTPHKRFLKGEPKTIPFQSMVLLPGEEPITADGVMTHEQLMPAWLIPAIALLAVIGGALVALWFLLLRPQVQSIATQETQQQVSQAASAAKQASQAASQASRAAEQASSGSGSGGSNGSSGGAAGGSTTGSSAGSGGAGGPNGGPGGSGAPAGSGASADTAFHISTGANAVTNGSFQNFSFTEPNHKTLDIGDLVLQNPRGDSGFLRVELGTNVILEEGLDNFRDIDYHYEVPLHLDPDEPITVAVNCVTPGPGASQCTPSVSLSGKTGS
ncbi:MAG TPA: hypothetical protein VJ914_03470 [Pseudonocardiaceae bacterium]|nr:hypothetical protein [Pseudonocardiaceae bacterium]